MAEYPPLDRFYVLSYANDDKDFPVIGVRRDPRVAGYRVPDDLSACPDKRFPNHVFTGSRPSNSDERVLHVYEILPSPWVPFTRYDDNLGPIQGRRRAVKNEGQVASLGPTQRKTYEAREGSANVFIESEENWSDGSGSELNPEFPIKTEDIYDERLGPVQIVRQIVVADGTEQGELITDGANVTEIEYESFNEYLLVKTVKTYSLPSVDLTGSSTGQWGIETSKRKSVVNGTSVDAGFGVKSSQVQPQGDGSSLKQTENYPPDSDGDGVIYTLKGQEQDETSGAIISVEKSLVDAAKIDSGSVATYIANLRSDQYTVEVQPLDKWHSITIASKITGAPRNETWTETSQISLPNELLEVGVIWDSKIDKDAGSAGVDDISQVVANDISWQVIAEVAISGTVTGRPYTKVRNGYNGPAETVVTRTFFDTPPTETIVVRKFQPVYGYVTIRGQVLQQNGKQSKYGVGDINVSSSGSTKFSSDSDLVIVDFGPVEHNNKTLLEKGDPKTLIDTVSASGGSTPGGGSYPAVSRTLSISGKASLEIPSSSLPLTSGQTFIKQVVTRPWRLGWWVREVYTAKVP